MLIAFGAGHKVGSSRTKSELYEKWNEKIAELQNELRKVDESRQKSDELRKKSDELVKKNDELVKTRNDLRKKIEAMQDELRKKGQ